MKKSIFSKFVSVAATVAISVFLLAGCAEDPANNNGGGGGGGNNQQQSGGDDNSSNSSQNPNNNSGGNSKVPARVTAVGSSSKSITISWSAVPDASSYYIYRNDQESGPYTRAGSMYAFNGTSYTDNGLADYTTYYYKVAAYIGSKEGEQSAPVSATTFLVAPTGVKAKSETSSSITINWNNLQYATAYRIFKYSNDDYTEVGTSTSNSYTDTGLPTNTKYSYKVSGYNNIAEGDVSSSVDATTILKAPTRVTAEGSSKSITISWGAVPDASSYYIYRSDQESGPYTRAGSMYAFNGTSYKDNGLADNTTYYYKVAAYSGNEGELSSPVSATTN